MNLKNLTDELLEVRLKKLVSSERKITHLVLQYIAEIDRRKLYLQRAYSSLFEFMVKEHGYSAAAAMRRIEGARLLIQIPEVSEKLESGALNLSQVALVQRAEREYKKETKSDIPIETKRELLSRIENQTQAKSEALISQELGISIVTKNKLTHHKDESVTLAITLTKEQLNALEQVWAMLSHAVPEKNWASLISYLAQKEISRRIGSNNSRQKGNATPREEKTPRREGNAPRWEDKASQRPHITSQRETKAPKPEPKSFTSVAETSHVETGILQITAQTSSRRRKAIGRKLKRQLLSEDAFCLFRDPQTGKTCGSRHFLQIDHIKSISSGGNNEPENLQVLCGKHNRYKYEREAGCVGEFLGYKK